MRWTTATVTATILLGTVLVVGCSDDQGQPAGEPSQGTVYQHAHTLLMGASDNAEVVRLVPGTSRVLLVSSKARKVTLLGIGSDRLEAIRDRVLLPDDTSESEITSTDVSADGTWAVLTRTIIDTDGSGAQTACRGELIFVDVTDSDSFGDTLRQIPVGSMPDAVAISDDQHWVVSANERDGPDAWGKCEVASEVPSISVVDILDGVSVAHETARIEMIDSTTGPREPESVAFGADNDLVMVTLQDSHELAIFRLSEVAGLGQPTSDDISIVELPPNSLGAKPWPDGVVRTTDGAGTELFAIAGEWNDTLILVDDAGELVANVEITNADIPASFPRVLDPDSPLFSPDSLVSFERAGRHLLAASLRHAGALVLFDVTDANSVAVAGAVSVGDDELGGQDDEGSTIRPEGITAAHDGAFIVTANEGESSVSLVLPVSD